MIKLLEKSSEFAEYEVTTDEAGGFKDSFTNINDEDVHPSPRLKITPAKSIPFDNKPFILRFLQYP